MNALEALTFVPEGLFGLIWTLQDKRSRWYQGQPDLSSMDLDGKDAYLGAGLASKDYGPKKRCPSAKIAGIRGLWADLDVADPAHKKPNLPPTIADALTLITTPEPTLIINSGHGLQAWWLFDEPWVFVNDDDRREAALLAQRWSDEIQSRAKERGWTVDAVHDLARIMRVPGTFNHKREPVMPVTVLVDDGPRYTREALAALVHTAAVVASAAPHVVTVEVTGAEPPQDKLNTLLAASEKFDLTWRRKRGEDLNDQSASGYDMALANLTVNAGWSDQEIADLLYAARRKYGDDLKRPDYYARTITKAHRASAAPESLLELGERCGVALFGFVEQTAERSSYRLDTELGSVTFDGVRDITTQARFRDRFREATHKGFLHCKSDKWEKFVVDTLFAALTTESLGKENTLMGQAQGWLDDYLEERDISDDPAQAHITKQPFEKDGYLYVHSEVLRKWLYLNRPPAPTGKELARGLRSIGAKPEDVNAGGRTLHVWRIRPYKERFSSEDSELPGCPDNLLFMRVHSPDSQPGQARISHSLPGQA